MYDDIYMRVSRELNIPVDVVKLAYSYQWKFIRHHLKGKPLNDPTLTEEQINDMRLNFNLPSLGKLFLTYDRWRRMQKALEITREIKRKQQESNEYKEDQT